MKNLLIARKKIALPNSSVAAASQSHPRLVGYEIMNA